MLGLPQSTEVKRPLPKAQLFKRFDWKPSQRDSFDGDVARLDFINWISPRTLPAIAEGVEVKEMFVIEVSLKKRDFDIRSIDLLAKSIPQHVIYALRFEEDMMFAVYHTKLFSSGWHHISKTSELIPLTGLNFDDVWSAVVAKIADLSVGANQSLSEAIEISEQRKKLTNRLEQLTRKMRTTCQNRQQLEIFTEIKRIKAQLKSL